MKKLLLVCAFIIGISAVSFAQGGGRRTPAEQVATLKTQLTGLTDDQSSKILAIYTVAGKSRDSLFATMQNGGGDRSTMMATFMKSQATTDAKIKAVLTPDQATAYQKIADDRAAAMKARMNGGN